MRSLKIILILLLVLSFKSNAQSQDSTSAKIYLVRSNGYEGSLLVYHCFIDSVLVCVLNNNEYSEHSITPGPHKINVTAHSKDLTNDKKSITITVVAGQSYYIKLMPPKGYDNKVPVMSVAETTIRPLISKSTLITNCLQ